MDLPAAVWLPQTESHKCALCGGEMSAAASAFMFSLRFNQLVIN